jgi:hypothetical protein
MTFFPLALITSVAVRDPEQTLKWFTYWTDGSVGPTYIEYRCGLLGCCAMQYFGCVPIILEECTTPSSGLKWGVHQPTRKLTKGRGSGHCSFKPVLHSELISGIGEQCIINHNWGCAYAEGFVLLAEGFDMFVLRNVAAGGRRLPSGSLSFGKRTLVGWLNPERLGLH